LIATPQTPSIMRTATPPSSHLMEHPPEEGTDDLLGVLDLDMARAKAT
jgi:hypothetical protein